MISILFAVGLLGANISSAASLESAKEQFSKGYYQSAYEELVSIAGSLSGQAELDARYLMALSRSKLQRFDEANSIFQKLASRKDLPQDFHYNYGQSLFAAQKFKEAVFEFKRSIIRQFKIGASAYYIGYIGQLTEDLSIARDFYARIQKMQTDEDKVKQAALLQLAELQIGEMPEKASDLEKRSYLKEKAMPALERAYQYDTQSSVGQQAQKRIESLEVQIASLAPKMRNGSPRPAKVFFLRLSQEIEYDSNVVTKADQSVSAVSNEDSLILRPSVFAKYFLAFSDAISLSPEFFGSSDFHGRRSQAEVYQNDSITMNPAIRVRHEHWMFGKAASMILDMEGAFMLRDYQQSHDYKFYYRYVNFVLGEKIPIFAVGSTTVKGGYKFYDSYSADRDAYTPSLSLAQSIRASETIVLSTTFSADWVSSRNDFYDEKNFKVYVASNFAKVYGDWDLSPSFSLALKDTMKQKGARGNEVTFTPSFDFSRELKKNLNASAKYAFTRNWSEEKANYQYKKHVFTLGLSHSY